MLSDKSFLSQVLHQNHKWGCFMYDSQTVGTSVLCVCVENSEKQTPAGVAPGDKEGKSHTCQWCHSHMCIHERLIRSKRKMWAEKAKLHPRNAHSLQTIEGALSSVVTLSPVVCSLWSVMCLKFDLGSCRPPDNNLSVFIQHWIINPEGVLLGWGGGLFFRKNIKASAICQYAFSDVQKAFEGPYMEVQDSKWREYTGKVPEPRPGSVSLIW